MGRPDRWPGLFLAVTVLVLRGCGPLAGPPRPGAGVPTFVGVMRSACSPWDGQALQIDLIPPDSHGPIDSVSISLWGTGFPTGPIVKSITNREWGPGEWCPKGGPSFQAAQGTVWMDRVAGGQALVGSFRLKALSGDRLVGTFRVGEDRQTPVFCG